MNAKKAKQLRRVAQGMTAGYVGIDLLAKPNPDHETYSAINNPKSPRGTYKALKRIAK